MQSGVLRKWSDCARYVFIKPDDGGGDVYANASSFVVKEPLARRGTRVTFELRHRDDGRYFAADVREILGKRRFRLVAISASQ